MRVIQLNKPGGLDQLQVVEQPDPTPGADEVLVKWHASSLNYHDYLVAIGGLPVEDQRIPMSDGAGEVIAVGAAVSEWQVGDKVMSVFFPDWLDGRPSVEKIAAIPGDSVDGYARDKACLPAGALTCMPDDYSYAEAATLPCAALTAWRGLIVEGGLQAGDSVLVEGTGGLSLFALQIAKAAGATVYATSSSDDKLERLKTFGADVVINYKTDPQWGATVNQLSGGGVDHVIDVGGSSTLEQSIAAVRVGGHIALIGILGGVTAELHVPMLLFKQIHMTGLAVGSREMQIDMIKAIDAGQIKPVVDRSFKFEQLAEAFRYQETGQHFGKIVIEY